VDSLLKGVAYPPAIASFADFRVPEALVVGMSALVRIRMRPPLVRRRPPLENAHPRRPRDFRRHRVESQYARDSERSATSVGVD
jgi:hypothetical protein